MHYTKSKKPDSKTTCYYMIPCAQLHFYDILENAKLTATGNRLADSKDYRWEEKLNTKEDKVIGENDITVLYCDCGDYMTACSFQNISQNSTLKIMNLSTYKLYLNLVVCGLKKM